MKTSLLIAMALAGLAMPAQAGPAEWMSGGDIKRELIDTELAFRGRYSGKIIYRNDGEMRMTSADGRHIFGVWRIDQETDSLCSTLTLRKARKEVCIRTRHEGFGYMTDQGYTLMPLGF